MKRETLQSIIRFLLNRLTRLEFIGLEHIPPEGGVIIATNHISRIDIPVLFVTPTRPDVTALVTDKYKRYPFFTFFVETAGAIWLDRTKADFGAFRIAAEQIKLGRAMGISPEGTRSTTGQLLEGKAGTVLLASRTGAPIVPVGLSGTASVMPSLLRLRRQPVVAHFGPAFTLPPIPRDNREAAMQEYTDEIMARIAVLLPEEQRGFYRDHPRVRQLLQEQQPGSNHPPAPGEVSPGPLTARR